jgi:hypothetical protein
MSVTQRFTGAAMKVFWIDASGTVDISGDYRALGVDDSLDTVDLSAGTDTAKFNKGTLADIKVDYEVMNTGTAGSATMYRLRRGQEGTIYWGELGTATGMPKAGLRVVVVKNSPDYKYDKEVMTKISFKGQGDWVYTPNSSTF